MLIYQTLLYLPAQLLGPAFQFLAAVAWTHWLSPSEYGVLSLVIAVQELVFYLCLSWWSQYTTRYYAAHQQDASIDRYQPTENGVLAASAVVQTLAALAALALSDAAFSGGLAAATVLFTVTRSITAHLAERARASGQIMAYTVAQTVGPVLGCLIGFLAIKEGEANATAVIAGFAAAQTLALPYLWWVLGLGRSIRIDGRILAGAARYGMPLLAAAVFTWISVNGLRVVIDKVEGAAAVGLVSVGWSLGQRASMVAAMLVTAAAYPLAVRRAVTHSREAALLQISQAGALLLGVIAPVTVGLLIVNGAAVDLLIGSEFQAITLSILPIAILSGAVRNLRVHYADQTFLLCESTGSTVAVCAIEAVLTISLCVAGLMTDGLVGACVGCLFAHAASAAMTFVFAAKRFALPLPWGHFARIGLATAIMAIGLRSLSWRATWGGLTLEVVMGALIYGAVVVALYRHDLRGILATWLSKPITPAALRRPP